MEKIYTVIGIAGLSLIIGELSGVMESIKIFFGLKRFRPFDCPLCLSFWLSLIYCVSTEATFNDYIFIVGSAPILTLLILKKIQE